MDSLKLSFRELATQNMELKTKWLNDPAVNQYLFDRPVSETTKIKQKIWFKKYKQDKSKKMFLVLFDNIPIGIVGLTKIDLELKTAHIFVMIGDTNFRGKKLSFPVLNFIIKFALNDLGLDVLIAEVAKENTPAIKLYSRAGFQADKKLSNISELTMALKK